MMQASSQARQPRSVLVVGAGLAGLVAARRLAQEGFVVRVLEASSQIGGRVGDREVRGIRFNAGARLIYPFSKPFNALLEELELSGSLVPIRHLAAGCRGDGEDWSLELMPGPKSLATPGLTVGERLAFLRYALRLALHRGRTDPDDAASALACDDETLADHVRRHLGANVLERMIEPVFRGTRSWQAEDISAAFFASTTPHLIGESTVYAFAEGMGQLPRALARGLIVELDTPVTRIEAAEAGFCSVDARRDGHPTRFEADIVLVAVEGSLASELVVALPAEDRSFLDSVRYNPLGAVHYKLKGQIAPRMSFFTRSASGPISTYQQIPGKEALGQASQLYVQLSPEATQRAREDGMTDRLDLLVEPRLRELYPTLDDERLDVHNQWIERKLPLFYPGYARAMHAFRERRGARPQRLYFCGDYLAQSLVTGAAASGERVAREIVAHWGGATR